MLLARQQETSTTMISTCSNKTLASSETVQRCALY